MDTLVIYPINKSNHKFTIISWCAYNGDDHDQIYQMFEAWLLSLLKIFVI